MQKLACCLLYVLLLSGCMFPGVYKINVQQGNIVDKAELAKLKPGMTHREVHFVLGTPLVMDPLDKSREYYIYTFQKHGGDIRKQQIVVYYDKNRYTHYEAHLLARTPAY